VRSLDAGERKEIAAYVNLDMVGSPNERIEVYDADDRVEEELRRALGGDPGERTVGAASDHWPFQQAGIAVGGIYTGGPERGPGGKRRDPCYHRACDTVRNADPALTARMATATEAALLRLRAR
jgi:aminopeptidase S